MSFSGKITKEAAAGADIEVTGIPASASRHQLTLTPLDASGDPVSSGAAGTCTVSFMPSGGGLYEPIDDGGSQLSIDLSTTTHSADIGPASMTSLKVETATESGFTTLRASVTSGV